MEDNYRSNPRRDLEDLIKQQGGNSLENCNWEFLGYQHGLRGEMPCKKLAHLGAAQKGYLSAKDYLHQQELKAKETSLLKRLEKRKAVEQNLIRELDRLIKEQGLSAPQNFHLELLGFQDGMANRKAQTKYWVSYAYQKGLLLGLNRFWAQKLACFPKEGEGL